MLENCRAHSILTLTTACTRLRWDAVVQGKPCQEPCQWHEMWVVACNMIVAKKGDLRFQLSLVQAMPAIGNVTKWDRLQKYTDYSQRCADIPFVKVESNIECTYSSIHEGNSYYIWNQIFRFVHSTNVMGISHCHRRTEMLAEVVQKQMVSWKSTNMTKIHHHWGNKGISRLNTLNIYM